MLLVVDVGNTNITFGVYDKKELVTTFRMMSKQPRTSDEYGISLRDLWQLLFLGYLICLPEWSNASFRFIL